MGQSTPEDTTARELRSAIRVRLLVAGLALAGVTIAFIALDPGEPATVPEAPLAGREPDPPSAPAASAALNTAPAASAVPAASEPPLAAVEPSEGERAAPGDAVIRDLASLAHSEGIIRTLRSPDAQDDSAPHAGAASPAAAKLPSGPYLQVGVFNHPANAAELKARLEAQGIPVFIATRVQVGPFKDRKEAEAMRAKLKAMGMASVLISQ